MNTYQTEARLSIDEFKDVLVRSILGERRPVNESDRLLKMLQHGNLIVTAREGGKQIGVSPSLTDFAFCAYPSGLAVDVACQKKGVGRELIQQTKLASPRRNSFLLHPGSRCLLPKSRNDSV